MNKEEFLKHITELGYNVGFGAKKHLATFDIIDKAPGIINFASLTVGIFSLIFEILTNKILSGFIAIFGIIGLYIFMYECKKADYSTAGTELTILFNELKLLYRKVKAADDRNVDSYLADLERIQNQFYEKCIAKQILFSDWYAHYKFFWQFQIEWINEQKRFSFLRDKIPLSFSLVCVSAAIIMIGFLLRL